MTGIELAISLGVGDHYWSSDWLWGLPLIVLTVLIHVIGLVMISGTANRASNRAIHRIGPRTVFVVVVGYATLLVTTLHGMEASIWAAAYLFLGAFADYKHAMLYSLNAITSYGHTNLSLQDHWHLMGGLEALDGWLLFGLTTAFLFALTQKLFFRDSFGAVSSAEAWSDHPPAGESRSSSLRTSKWG
jgi:hypothetical protein